MDKKKQRGLAIWALVIALIMTSVAYAVLQTTLSISGTVTRKGGTFNVHFTNVEYYAGEELTTTPEVSGTNLNFKVTLNKPGDYTTIRFKILNSSSFEVTHATFGDTITVGDDSRSATLAGNGGVMEGYSFPSSNGYKLSTFFGSKF